MLQCINGVSSNLVEGRTKILQLKDLILTVWFNFQTYIYIYIVHTLNAKILNFVKRQFKQYFSYIVAVSFIGGGNQSTPGHERGIEHTTLVVIGTDCTGS